MSLRPAVQRASITFDPYLFLSLPIPQQTHSYREVMFVPSRATAAALKRPHPTPFVVTVQLPKHASVSDIKQNLGVALRLPLQHGKLLLTELHDGRILKALQETSLLDKVRDKDVLCMYDIDELIHNRPGVEKWTTIQVVQFVRSEVPGGKLRQVALPTVVALPSHQLSAMPVRMLYQRLQDCTASVVAAGDDDNHSPMHVDSATSNGASTMDDADTAAPPTSSPPASNGHSSSAEDPLSFDAVLMDRSLKGIICDIPRPKGDADTTEVDLLGRSANAGGFSLACVHPASHAALLVSPSGLESVNPVDAGLVAASARKHLTIFDCLQAFTNAETLRKSEAWYCSTCKQHQQASKKIDLWTAPAILILHLKRFSFTQSYRDKLDMKVDFPIEGLDLSSFVRGGAVGEGGPSLIYDLYAVSNHYGGLGGGHYTAFAKNLKNGAWYSLDDSSVGQVHAGSVVTEAAYVLFYHRKGLGKPPPVAVTTNGRVKKGAA